MINFKKIFNYSTLKTSTHKTVGYAFNRKITRYWKRISSGFNFQKKTSCPNRGWILSSTIYVLDARTGQTVNDPTSVLVIS